MGIVIDGPAQRWATVEVVDEQAHVMGKGWYGTDKAVMRRCSPQDGGFPAGLLWALRS